MTIPNLEFEAKYADLMGVTGEMEPSQRLTRPRPGHADLVGAQKYGFDDVRNVLERASARETAARVAAGSFCRWFLAELGMQVVSHVVRIGSVKAPARVRAPTPDDSAAIDRSRSDAWTPTPRASMVAEIDRLRKAATPSAGSSRCSRTAPRRGSAPTCTTIGSSTPASPWPS